MKGRWLLPGGHLDRYVGTLFLTSFATAVLLVVGLFLILDMAANLDDYLGAWPDGSRVPTLVIVRYYLFQVPFVFLQVAPFITLVAGLFTVAKLLKHSETVAALAAGISAHRVLAPVFLLAACVAAGMFGLREGLAGRIANSRDALRFVLENKQWDWVLPHIRVRDLNGSWVLCSEFRPTVGDPPVAEARDFQATLHDSSDTWSTTVAERAVYAERDGRVGWWLDNGVQREVRGEHATERPVHLLEGFEFTPTLALSYWRATDKPLELSFGEVRELMRRDPDRAVYQTLFQYSLTFPLANLVLLLVGLPVLMRHERGKTAEGLALGCLLCVFYFAVDFAFRNLGLQSSMDPRYAAWLPILFFGSLGLVLYDSMRT
jgi:lipopolysaccharide export system permease protein